jgi:hypothetical protein
MRKRPKRLGPTSLLALPPLKDSMCYFRAL